MCRKEYFSFINIFPIFLLICRSLKGLLGFDKLQELVLDNNNLSDDVEFPKMESLETLTINKNSVSFHKCNKPLSLYLIAKCAFVNFFCILREFVVANQSN